MNTVQIRKVRYRDWGVLKKLFSEHFPEIAPATVSYYLRQNMDRMRVARLEGVVVGFFYYGCSSQAGVARLDYIAVSERHRNTGIGKALLGVFEQQARDAGFSAAGLDVLQDNRAAIRFYERHGYALQYDVEGQNKVRYQKGLTQPADPRRMALACRSPSLLKRVLRRAVYTLMVGVRR